MKYLVVDDHRMMIVQITVTLEKLLHVPPEDIIVARTAAELFKKAAAIDGPLLVVLDLILPDGPRRLALVTEVLSVVPHARIVVYSADDSPFLAEDVIRAGALAYLGKGCGNAVFVRGVEEASKGRRYVDPAIDLTASKEHPWRALSDRQRQILLALCKGTSMKALAVSEGLSFNTISSHKSAALKCLGLAGKPDLHIGKYLLENGLNYLLD